MTTELARIEHITPAELFKPGAIDPILSAIETEVRREAACLDISTPENRKALASLAFKVAKSKTYVDARGKELVADRKEEVKAIDRERSRVWDRFESLQLEVRKPLTDWENAEKERVANHEAALKELVDAGNLCELNWNNPGWSAGLGQSRLAAIMASTYDWQEFHQRAVATVTVTIRQIKEAIAKREKWEAEQEELTRLRAAQALRDQQEREERIAREAKEKAEAEAARVAAAAARVTQEAQERVEREKAEAEARAKQAEAQRAQLEAQAKAAAAKAAQEAKDAVEREKSIRQLAAEKAERDRVAAVDAERKRVADAKAAEEAATEKREVNKRHCAKINREVRDALMQQEPITKYLAEIVVKAIAQDLIPHTKITY